MTKTTRRDIKERLRHWTDESKAGKPRLNTIEDITLAYEIETNHSGKKKNKTRSRASTLRRTTTSQNTTYTDNSFEADKISSDGNPQPAAGPEDDLSIVSESNRNDSESTHTSPNTSEDNKYAASINSGASSWENAEATNLFDAVLTGKAEIVQKVLDGDPDTNLRDEDDNTPLMYAAMLGYNDIIELLLDHRADIHAKNIFGDTAIAPATVGNHILTLELLAKRGASLDYKNKHDIMPLDLAQVSIDKATNEEERRLAQETKFTINHLINRRYQIKDSEPPHTTLRHSISCPELTSKFHRETGYTQPPADSSLPSISPPQLSQIRDTDTTSGYSTLKVPGTGAGATVRGKDNSSVRTAATTAVSSTDIVSNALAARMSGQAEMHKGMFGP